MDARPALKNPGESPRRENRNLEQDRFAESADIAEKDGLGRRRPNSEPEVLAIGRWPEPVHVLSRKARYLHWRRVVKRLPPDGCIRPSPDGVENTLIISRKRDIIGVAVTRQREAPDLL